MPQLFRSFEALIERMVKFRYKDMEAEFKGKLREFAVGSKSELVKQVLVSMETGSDDAQGLVQGPASDDVDHEVN